MDWRAWMVMSLWALVAGCGTSRNATQEKTLDWGGETRRYLVHVPDRLDSGGPHPVVLVFHGGMDGALDVDGAASIGRYTNMSTKADEAGFIAVYPAARTDNWNDGRNVAQLKDQNDNVDDVGFVRALLDALAKEFPVDDRRIYATGISNGGIFSHRLACELSERITAIAPVAGALASNLESTCAPYRHVPVLMLHGTADGFVPVDGGTVTAPFTRQDRGRVVSADATRDTWATLNGCGLDTTHSSRNNVPDGTSLDTFEVQGCPTDGAVVQMIFKEGGHTWPGARWYPYLGRVSREVKAEDVIWDFFKDKHR